MEHVLVGLVYFGGYASLSFLTSVLIWLLLRAAEGRLDRLTPAAQSRVVFALAIAPGFVAFSSSIASGLDVLLDGPQPFCQAPHSIANRPSIFLVGLSLVASWRVVTVATRLLTAMFELRKLRRSLRVEQGLGSEVVVTSGSDPKAFVLGLLKPRIYVTRTLVEGSCEADLRLIVNHERAHVQRRDPLRRVIAALGCVFHIPWVASELQTRLARAQETAADDQAAPSRQDRLRLAELMVRMARTVTPSQNLAFQFAAGSVESRVRNLLSPKPVERGPSLQAL
ncbi:MAG TPA: M56 family metallopeptidase, partial [Bryobacteraceae bacterium]|nr:M56 family metallopeptidase [Bryobacteraceae bacterium]